MTTSIDWLDAVPAQAVPDGYRDALHAREQIAERHRLVSRKIAELDAALRAAAADLSVRPAALIAASSDLTAWRAIAEVLPPVPAVPEDAERELLRRLRALIVTALASPLALPAYAAETVHYCTEHMGVHAQLAPMAPNALVHRALLQPKSPLVAEAPRALPIDLAAVSAVEQVSAAGVALYSAMCAALDDTAMAVPDKAGRLVELALTDVPDYIAAQRRAAEQVARANADHQAVSYRCRNGGTLIPPLPPIHSAPVRRTDGHEMPPTPWVLREAAGPSAFDALRGART